MVSCKEEKAAVPKPHSYPRIEFDEKSYTSFVQPDCPVKFEYPNITLVDKKKFFFNEEPDNECWFNIRYPAYNATIYFTYYKIGKDATLEELIDDAFTLASKHNDKANSREEASFENKQGLTGIIFEIGGPVASPVQFYVTDNSENFLRGSLYFDESNVTDSLDIVVDYILEDVNTILATAQFSG